MGSSRKPRSSDPAELLRSHVHAVLSRHVAPAQHLNVALSGGLDSVVLLDLLAALRGDLRYTLSATHVHHGLSPNADAWAGFCERLCAALEIPLQVHRVRVERRAEDGVEAAARQARYRVLSQSPADYVVLAHHRDDQAETLLLQLLRGAGVKGLSAMGEARRRLLRPLLGVSRADLAAYAGERRLAWVDDESNDDSAYARNFLRRDVLPLLRQRFPACAETLARSAGHLSEAAALLDDLAALDAAGAVNGDALAVERLAALPTARAKNLLRWFIDGCGALLPSAARLDEMLEQALGARTDASLCVEWGEWELRRHQGRLHVQRRPAASVEEGTDWGGEARVELPHLQAVLNFRRATGTGVSAAKLAAGAVTFSPRRGGERLQPDGRRPRRTLKNLLQEAGLPPWRRDRLPLVYCGDALVCVPGVGVDWAWQAEPEEPGWLIALEWVS